MNKKKIKEIKKKTGLRKKFLNTKSDIDRKAYDKQRDFRVSLIRSGKKNFFDNINRSDIADNKTFWKAVKLFFTDKIKIKSKITLIEKKMLSRAGQEEQFQKKIFFRRLTAAEVFNSVFVNVVPNLKIPTAHGYDTDFIATDDQVTNALNPNIIMIKKNKKSQSFSFAPVTYEDLLKRKTLDTAKASQQFDIPSKILKQNSD